jgi:V/A-type H+-transporting ATPase subunit E
MESKIQELTEKLLNEGVEKGRQQAQAIIDEANLKAQAIIDDAKKQAENIKNTAKEEAQQLDKNTKAELKMFNEQALNALKSEITNVVSDKIVKQAVGELVDDKTFMQQFVLKIAEKWAQQEDVVISVEDTKGLKELFAKKAKNLLDKGVEIKQINGKDTLFSVQPADGAYKVNFGKEEFEDYFKSFLRPQLIDMLF